MAITRLGGANAITGTLPAANINDTSIGNITALPAGVGGKVLQIVGTTTGTETSTTSTTYVDTNLTASITPSSTSSKIYISLSGVVDDDQATNNPQISLFRGATDIFSSTISGFAATYSSSGRQASSVGLAHLDSPSTTSSTTYTVKIKQPGGPNTVKFCAISTTASMVLMEIAG